MNTNDPRKRSSYANLLKKTLSYSTTFTANKNQHQSSLQARSLANTLMLEQSPSNAEKIGSPMLKGYQSYDTHYKKIHINYDERNFVQMQHIFTAIGPSRSMKAIEAKVIVFNKPDKPKCIDIHKFNNDHRKYCQSMSSKFALQGTLEASKPRTISTTNGTHKPQPFLPVHSFFKQLSNINTHKQNVEARNLDLSRLTPKHLTTYQTQYPTSIRETNKYLKKQKVDGEHVSATGSLNEGDRQQLNKFLTNKWVQHCIDTKSLRDQGRFVERLKHVESDQAVKEIKEYYDKKLIREDFQEATAGHPYPQPYEMVTNLPSALGQYMQSKSYLNGNFRQKIDLFDEVHWKMLKHKDENDLMEFNGYYERIIHKRRFKQRVKCLIKRSKQLGIQIYELIEKKMVSFKPYETKGSYALIKLAKQGQNEQLMKLLHQNAYLVHDFDEESRTALHWAVLKQHVDSTKLLLACNAHPAALDAYGKSVLDYGLQTDSIEILNIILKYWSPPDEEYLHYLKEARSREAIQEIRRNKVASLIQRVSSNKLKEYLRLLL